MLAVWLTRQEEQILASGESWDFASVRICCVTSLHLLNGAVLCYAVLLAAAHWLLVSWPGGDKLLHM